MNPDNGEVTNTVDFKVEEGKNEADGKATITGFV